MTTGNWVYDRQMAREQAREVADAIANSQRESAQNQHPASLARQAQLFCSKCGREWDGYYFSAKALLISFGVGAIIGLIACAELVRYSPWLW